MSTKFCSTKLTKKLCDKYPDTCIWDARKIGPFKCRSRPPIGDIELIQRTSHRSDAEHSSQGAESDAGSETPSSLSSSSSASTLAPKATRLPSQEECASFLCQDVASDVDRARCERDPRIQNEQYVVRHKRLSSKGRPSEELEKLRSCFFQIDSDENPWEGVHGQQQPEAHRSKGRSSSSQRIHWEQAGSRWVKSGENAGAVGAASDEESPYVGAFENERRADVQKVADRALSEARKRSLDAKASERAEARAQASVAEDAETRKRLVAETQKKIREGGAEAENQARARAKEASDRLRDRLKQRMQAQDTARRALSEARKRSLDAEASERAEAEERGTKALREAQARSAAARDEESRARWVSAAQKQIGEADAEDHRRAREKAKTIVDTFKQELSKENAAREWEARANRRDGVDPTSPLRQLCREYTCHGMSLRRCIEAQKKSLDDFEEALLAENPGYVCPLQDEFFLDDDSGVPFTRASQRKEVQSRRRSHQRQLLGVPPLSGPSTALASVGLAGGTVAALGLAAAATGKQASKQKEEEEAAARKAMDIRKRVEALKEKRLTEALAQARPLAPPSLTPASDPVGAWTTAPLLFLAARNMLPKSQRRPFSR